MACDNSDMRTTPACTPGMTVCSDDEAATLEWRMPADWASPPGPLALPMGAVERQ